MPKPTPKKTEPDARPKNALRRAAHTLDAAEDKLMARLFSLRIWLFVAAVTVLAIWMRTGLYPLISMDFAECLDPWMNEIRAGGGFHSLDTQIGNYTSPYHYLMAAMAYIPGLDNLAAIKLPSIAADFCMAAVAAVIVYQLTRKAWKSALCYTVLLCLPTVFLNSAAWAQCDAMYTTLILLFFCLHLANKNAAALLVYGLALSVKLQAIFVLPAVIIFWLCGRIRLRHLLCGAAGYVLAFVPAMLASGNLSPLYRAYAMQTVVNSLSSSLYNGASLFLGITDETLPAIATALTTGCLLALGVLALYCWQHKEAFTTHSALVLLALCSLVVPFLLPAMHDRYYFVAEVLVVIYAFLRPARFWLPAALQFCALPVYCRFLFHAEINHSQWYVLFPAAVIFALLWDLRVSFAAPAQAAPEQPAPAVAAAP